MPPFLNDSLTKIVRATDTPVAFAEGWLGWSPHEGQRRWLTAPQRQTAVLVTGRRWGKSEVAAVQCLYYAIFLPRTRQGIVSVTLDQARLSFDAAVSFCTRQPLLSAFIRRITDSPFPRIQFKNGSEITVRTAARHGVYLRGHKFDRVVIDEADYLSEEVINEVVRMTLVDTGGTLVLISTPRSRRGLVYRELQRGLAGDTTVYAQTGPTWENPNVDHAYLQSLRDKMTEAAWQREVEGIYTDDDVTVFRWSDIQAAYEGVVWPMPVPPDPTRRYVAGWDLAKAEDWTVGCVLDVTERPYRLVFFDRFQRQPWPAVAMRIRETHLRYRCHQTLIDATGVGAAVLDEVSDVASGFVFTARSKTDLLANLQLMLEKRQIIFPFIRPLVDELSGYQWDDKAIETDCVMSLALAAWAAGPHYRVEFAPSLW